MSNFMTPAVAAWFLESNKKKAEYPAEWQDAVNEDGNLTGPSAGWFSGKLKQTHLSLGCYRVVNALFDGSAWFGMTNRGDIMAETPDPSDSEARLAAVFDSGSKTVFACRVAGGDMTPLTLPEASPDALWLALLVKQSDQVGDSVVPHQILKEMACSHYSPEKVSAYRTHFGNLCGGMSLGIVANPRGAVVCLETDTPLDVDAAGNLPALTPQMVAEYAASMDAERTKKFSFRKADAEPSVFLADGLASSKETEEERQEREAKERAEKLAELRKKYGLKLHHRLSSYEEGLIPRLPASYVVNEALVDVAKRIHDDWESLTDLGNNLIFEGPAGSGKTAGSKFLAAIWGIPRTKMTMSPTTESANLIGAFYPVFNDIGDWGLTEAETRLLEAVMALETTTATSSEVPSGADLVATVRRRLASREARDLIRDCYNIPSREEVALDPAESWERMGHDGPAPEASEVMLEAENAFDDALYRMTALLVEKGSESSVSYKFVESELMRAFRHGWLVEIQEAASILRPGVLTELNSLLEPGGRIELPNGQFIRRHPDTIVVFTTNSDYVGNVELNESLRDRCVIGLYVPLPSVEEMAARAVAQTGVSKSDALEAAKTILAVNETAVSRNIKGSFGMRSLLAWCRDLKRGDYSETSFLTRVIYKMTTRQDDVEELVAVYRENCAFCRKMPSGRRRRK